MGMACLLGFWLVVVFDCRKRGLNLVAEYFSFLERSRNFQLSQEPGSDHARACRVEIPSGLRACGDILKRNDKPEIEIYMVVFM